MGSDFPVTDNLKRIVNDKSFFDPIIKKGHKLTDKATQYEIYALALEKTGSSELSIASSYLKATWIANSKRERKKEVEYRLLAIEHFKKALDKNEFDDKERRNQILYLIGALYRRIGEFEQAIEWFSKVPNTSNFKLYSDKMKNLAQQKDSSKQYFEK